MPHHSLGIDIGGTFTDIVVYDHDSGRQGARPAACPSSSQRSSNWSSTSRPPRRSG
jgi:N-methylhydantoinase A/oxoprolinase/acetone carboxylase beta subunit